jgi:hypothetical protein
MTVCVFCRGPKGTNTLEITMQHESPKRTITGSVSVCLDCSHTRNVTPAHLFELGRQFNERSVHRAQAPQAQAGR